MRQSVFPLTRDLECKVEDAAFHTELISQNGQRVRGTACQAAVLSPKTGGGEDFLCRETAPAAAPIIQSQEAFWTVREMPQCLKHRRFRKITTVK